ncbi:MAG: PH domain-containing protein [Rhizobiales bacterium]|nr:PH domain-containing protein [Hyphomicrobiales bacterium]
MSYVKRVLQPGEVVRHTATIHWIVYWPGVLLMLAAAAVLIWARFLPQNMLIWLQGLAGLLTVVALFLLIREWFGWWTTEVAVTNLRVIYKTGFINRRTNEMNMDKVESVQVDQSILGRILDYGTVTITGTGVGLETLTGVAQPIDLRNSITAVASH